MRRVALVLALGALAIPAAAVGMDMGGDSGGRSHVSILFGSLTPVKVDVVAGGTVDWTNDSVRDHTVTADDGSYDSGTLKASTHFARMFDTPGTYAYHCRLHPYIRGEVDVYRVLLDRPTQPAGAGKLYPLSGRAALPAGNPVGIEFDSGSGWQHVADTTVGADGRFMAEVTASTSGSYRAVTGDDQSPAVDLLVLNRAVSAHARNGVVTATVAPASPGATVVLQLYLKERFGWWPVAKHKLGKRSSTTFRLPAHRRVSARVVLTLPDGATVLATSPVLKRPGRTPRMPMHH